MPKLHEVWPGNNRFCLGGISGPLQDLAANAYVYITIIVVVVVTSIFVTGTVWEVSPILPLAFYVLVLVMLVFLVLTTCTDPGIIPRKPFLERFPEKYSIFLLESIKENENIGSHEETNT